MTFAKGKKIAARSAEILAALLALLLIAAGISAFVCSRVIKVTQYDVELDGITNPVKLVVVSDIHGKVFGDDNEPLCELVAAQEPDAIVLLGDLFPSDFQEADAAYVLHLTEQMQSIAPVYFAMGNHEKSYTARYGDTWIDAIKDTGATVFDETCLDLELRGNTIRFGGSMGHGYLFGRTEEQFEASSDYKILTEMQESPYPAILLAHWPDTVALSDGPRRWKIDLVLCGSRTPECLLDVLLGDELRVLHHGKIACGSDKSTKLSEPEGERVELLVVLRPCPAFGDDGFYSGDGRMGDVSVHDDLLSDELGVFGTVRIVVGHRHID